MTRTKLSQILTFTACLALVLFMLGNQSLVTNVAASDGQNDKEDKVSHDLRRHVSSGSTEKASVILQLNGPVSGRLNALLKRNGIHTKRQFTTLNSSAVELPVSVIDELASNDEVQSVSSDDQIISMGHVTSTTGADDVRTDTTSTGN